MEPWMELGLARLRDPNGAALRSLATIAVADVTRTPIRDLASPRWVASQAKAVLEAATRTDVLRDWVSSRIHEERARWSTEQRALRVWMVPEVDRPLRDVLARPYAPNEALTLRVIDHPAMRALVREVLEDTLTRFNRKLKSLDVGGLGARAAGRGKSLLSGLRANIGSIGDGLVGALSDEIEGVFQERLQEFLDKATGEALKTISRHLADSSHSRSFGDLRLAVLDVVLDTPIRELASELDKTRPEEVVDVIVAAVRSAIAAPDFVDGLERRMGAAMNEVGDGTLGAWLDEVGLGEVWAETTTELVATRLQAVVAGDAFEAWWRELFTP
jgi:hypothetical protein